MKSSSEYNNYLKYVRNLPPNPIPVPNPNPTQTPIQNKNANSVNSNKTLSVSKYEIPFFDFNNNFNVFSFEHPLIMNKDNKLTLDLSSKLIFDTSEIYMKNLPSMENGLYYLTIDDNKRLGYCKHTSLNTSVSNKDDVSNNDTITSEGLHFINEMNIIQGKDNTKRIYSLNDNIHLNPSGSLIMNGNNIDIKRGQLMNVANINGSYDRDINIQSYGNGNILLNTEQAFDNNSSIYLGKDGVINIKGKKITIGDLSSNVNIFGKVHEYQIENPIILNHTMTLNKNGIMDTVYGCGFEIECIGYDKPVGYLKMSNDGMSYDIGVPGDMNTNYTMLMTNNNNGNLSINNKKFSINENIFELDLESGLLKTDSLETNTATINTLLINKNININGDLSSNCIITNDANINKNLVVKNNAIIHGSSRFLGDIITNNKICVKGKGKFTGDVDIGGVLDIKRGINVIEGANIYGSVNLLGNTNVVGQVNITGDTVIVGNENIKKNIIIDGDTSIGGNISVRKSLSVNNMLTVEKDVFFNGENIKMNNLCEGSNNTYMITYDKTGTKQIGFKSINELGITEMREMIFKLQKDVYSLNERLSMIEKNPNV